MKVVVGNNSKEYRLDDHTLNVGSYALPTKYVMDVYKRLTKYQAKVIVEFDMPNCDVDIVEIEVFGESSHQRHIACNSIINKIRGNA